MPPSGTGGPSRGLREVRVRPRHAYGDVRRAQEFEAFVAGAGGRLLHTATLLTAEPRGRQPARAGAC